MIHEMIQRFKIHLEEDGKSPKTIESYVGDNSASVTFIEEEKPGHLIKGDGNKLFKNHRER